MKKFLLLLLPGLLAMNAARAQTVTTDSIYSAILNRKVAATVILPATYDTSKTYPVLYMLHWWGGNHQSFLGTSLLAKMKDQPLIIVTPEADTTWYVNSFSDPANRYGDFLSQELFSYMDKKYKTNKKQGIGGYSMGGYGALLLGLKHPERFVFIADICGAIQPPFYDVPLTVDSPLNYIINSVRVAFGDEQSYTPGLLNIDSVLKSVEARPDLFIYIALARQDEFEFIRPGHQKLISELEKKNIGFQFLEFEGGHFSGQVFDECLPGLIEKMSGILY